MIACVDVVGRGQHRLHRRRRQRRDELDRELVERVAQRHRHDAVAVGDREHVEVPAELLGQQPRRERVDLRVVGVADRVLVEDDEAQARVARQAAVEGRVVEPLAVGDHSAALRSSWSSRDAIHRREDELDLERREARVDELEIRVGVRGGHLEHLLCDG